MRARRTLTPLIALVVALALVSAACGSGDEDVTAAPAATDSGAADDGSAESSDAALLPTVAGGQLDLGSLEGQDTVLWFWAPW